MSLTGDEHIDEEWSGRVSFSEHAGIAYRPGEVIVPDSRFDDAVVVLAGRTAQVDKAPLRRTRDDFDLITGQRRLTDIVDALDAVDDLRAEGIQASPNHVMFSHCMCCGPHPALLSAYPFSANPFSANPFSANPFSANPFSANPFSANPFSANPANYDPSPLVPHASARTLAEAAAIRATGEHSHSAEPARRPDLPPPPVDGSAGQEIVIVDTGLAQPPPHLLTTVDAPTLNLKIRRTAAIDRWDSNNDGQLDSAAGHGTFIAGIIKMIAPTSSLMVQGPLSSFGDIDEVDLATVLLDLAERPDKPALVNLSLGGYAVSDMPVLARAIRELQGGSTADENRRTIVVASAGNDATCRPAYPAALPGVVSVGALGPFGAAHFTNYGPWVRACAPGVDVVSTFFDGVAKADGDEFTGWARWSGTSFATPAVVGALAIAIGRGLTKKQAVDRLIDDPGLFRIPGLGAVVNQTPWWLTAS